MLFGLTHRRGLASVPARLHVGLNILRSSNRRMLSTDSTLASRINSLVRQNNGGRLPSQQVKVRIEVMAENTVSTDDLIVDILLLLLQGQGRRNISFMSERRLMRLEQEADANPTNAKKQLEYLRVCVGLKLCCTVLCALLSEKYETLLCTIGTCERGSCRSC